MTVGEIVYRILGDDRQFSGVMDSIGKKANEALGLAAKAAAAVTASAATAVGVLAKSAAESYADYEQLAGGAQLMFGDAYDFIAEKAKTAFKDVQMSQNDYLQQVNGFAVGLKTAMGGDKLGAAKLADRIVTAEADIVAATGNTAENVQNAFNGIMKSNYTMLDNLQIGITPTKEGFQELIDTVNAYKAAHGEATNYTIDNLADCQNALVDYIEMQKLSGYAQEEGVKTLAGSMASMKAAWQNLLTGMADPAQDLEGLISDLVGSVEAVGNNLMPVLTAILPQMAQGVTELTASVLPMIPETLNAMLPDVLSGAQALISALLETLSGIAETAIPIVTDSAGDIIDTLIGGLASSAPRLASSAADLCTALITAIFDNAGVITQGAADIVVSLATGIGDNLDRLIPAAVNAVLEIADTFLNNVDEMLDAGAAVIEGLLMGLTDALPDLLEKAPVVITKLLEKFFESIPQRIEAAIEICKKIGEELTSFDWSEIAQTTWNNLGNALEDARKGVALAIDNMLGGEVYGGDINNVHLTDIPNWMKIETENIEKAGDDYSAAADAATASILAGSAAVESGIEAARAAARNASSQNDGDTEGMLNIPSLKEQLEEKEKLYAVHKLTEEEYWAERKRILEENRDDNDPEWWKLYDKVTEHYEKLGKTAKQEAEKAAREQKAAEREAETALKNSVSDKFRELETEQLEKGYDDSWLMAKERAFLDTLDHNSDVYKEYNLKLLKEQKTASDKAAKEAETEAKKQRDTLKKEYDKLISARDSYAGKLDSTGGLFKTSETTDKSTGEKRKSRNMGIEELEKKIAAKKKLSEKIAKLYEKGASDELVRLLLKNDPEDALSYATELLSSPEKLEKIKKAVQTDTDLSKELADMVVAKTDDFTEFGNDAGSAFGEGFMKGFDGSLDGLEKYFTDEYTAESAANISAANKTAAQTTTVRRGGQSDEKTDVKKSASGAAQSGGRYRIVDIDGHYVATVVNAENSRNATAGGG